MCERIVILTATELEQRPLRARWGDRHGDKSLVWRIGGMGAGATAAETLRIARDEMPTVVVQAGIAGALPEASLALAETVLVGSDRQADLGAWRSETGGRFEPFDRWAAEAATVVCPYVSEGMGERFRVVAARSVNCACAPIPIRDLEAVESMEGAAFFGVCRDEGIPFFQLRAVSNRVGDPRDAWRIPEALDALGDALGRLLDDPDFSKLQRGR